MENKPTDIKEKEAQLSEQDKLIIEKINTLRQLVSESLPQPSIGGSETVYRAVFDESEIATIKDKIFQLIHKL